MKKILPTLLLSTLLTSCGTVSHIPMNQQEKSQIKTISVNPSIKKPEQMYEFVSGAQFGMAFGAIGGAVSGLSNANAAKTNQKIIENNKISIQKIVYNEWQHEIKDKSRFKLANYNNGDAQLETEIVTYGISIPHGFSTDYVPVLKLNAKLIHHNKIVWQDSGSVLPLTSGMPRYKMAALLKDPENFKIMWNKAAEKITSDMVKDMNK